MAFGGFSRGFILAQQLILRVILRTSLKTKNAPRLTPRFATPRCSEVVEVFVHDPLYFWSLTPAKPRRDNQDVPGEAPKRFCLTQPVDTLYTFFLGGSPFILVVVQKSDFLWAGHSPSELVHIRSSMKVSEGEFSEFDPVGSLDLSTSSGLTAVCPMLWTYVGVAQN